MSIRETEAGLLIVENDDLKARIATLEAALRRIEWACRDDYDDQYCSVCDGVPVVGHNPGCAIAAALSPSPSAAPATCERCDRLTRLAAMLASAVKCGEEWSDTLEREYRAAVAPLLPWPSASASGGDEACKTRTVHGCWCDLPNGHDGPHRSYDDPEPAPASGGDEARCERCGESPCAIDCDCPACGGRGHA